MCLLRFRQEISTGQLDTYISMESIFQLLLLCSLPLLAWQFWYCCFCWCSSLLNEKLASKFKVFITFKSYRIFFNTFFNRKFKKWIKIIQLKQTFYKYKHLIEKSNIKYIKIKLSNELDTTFYILMSQYHMQKKLKKRKIMI